jgi:hypothetical protein
MKLVEMAVVVLIFKKPKKTAIFFVFRVLGLGFE